MDDKQIPPPASSASLHWEQPHSLLITLCQTQVKKVRLKAFYFPFSSRLAHTCVFQLTVLQVPESAGQQKHFPCYTPLVCDQQSFIKKKGFEVLECPEKTKEAVKGLEFCDE